MVDRISEFYFQLLFVQQLFLNDWWTAPQWNLRKKFIFKFKLSLSSNHGSSLEMSECFHSCSLSVAVIVWSNLKGNLDIKRKSANFTLMVSFCLVFVPSVHSQTYAVTWRNHLLLGGEGGVAWHPQRTVGKETCLVVARGNEMLISVNWTRTMFSSRPWIILVCVQ